MYRLEVLHTKALEVLLGGLNTRMTQNSRQVKKVPARAKVAHRERVPERMEGTADTNDVQQCASVLKIAKYVSL